MGYVPQKTKKSANRLKLVPGVYSSTVIDVYPAKGFAPGEAFTVKYQLTDGKNTYIYPETFIDDANDSRTNEFFKHLKDNGYDVDDLDSIVGMKENLTLLKQKRGRGIYLNVYDREYQGHGEVE